MKYVQPWGISDPDASYINGDPSIARKGSIPPAAAFEHPMRELVEIIDKSFMVPSESDLGQVSKGVRSQRMNYAEDTGSVNTLSVAYDPPLTAYTIGLPLRVKIRGTSTGPSTIDAGAGRVAIRKPSGAELGAGDLPAGGLAELVYDGTVFQMINFGGAGGGLGDVFQINIPYAVDSSVTPNTVIANFSPAIGTYAAGLIFMVKISNTNTSFSNINVNGLGLKPIYAQGGHPNWPLLPGDLQVGDVLVFVYDGSAFWIYANTTINQNVTFNVSSVTQIDQLFVALGRKRISTSGTVRLLLAAGIYGPAFGLLGQAVITTYHADADRITLEGTMLAGQVPPSTGHFQRSGSSSANRAADSAFNILMLRARYGTEIRMPSTAGIGIQHLGPGQIIFKNILVTGPNVTAAGSRGFSADSSAMTCVGCSTWAIGDVGFVTSGGGHLYAIDCHASGCITRGFAAVGSTMHCRGGGSYGNASAGIEAAHGASIGTSATDAGPGNLNGTLPFGFQSSVNGYVGASADSGTIYAVRATIIVNEVIDMYAFNMGIVKQYLSSVGGMSPVAGAEGNLNAISVNYG